MKTWFLDCFATIAVGSVLVVVFLIPFTILYMIIWLLPEKQA